VGTAHILGCLQQLPDDCHGPLLHQHLVQQAAAAHLSPAEAAVVWPRVNIRLSGNAPPG
jgi:hypothetical protein